MANLKDLINAYGRACVRDGNPAWESAEGQALAVALEAPVQDSSAFTKTERKRLSEEQYEQILKDNLTKTGRYLSLNYYDPWGIIMDLEEAHGIKE